ncbi:MAG: gamma-butyrobetaine hydroxylase-like domain-containing protein [Candidatus Binataceae bacterium]
MVLGKSKTPPRIKGLNEVGRYAVGVQWVDGHDSIFPLENLRRFCPCNGCAGEVEGEIAADAQRLLQLSRIGDKAIFLAWADGHETFYTMEQLREQCRCAYCVQEPEKPITGG